VAPLASQPAVLLTLTSPCLQIDYMSEDDARWIFQQLIVAVDYCHRLGIANRDIKVRDMHP
jgi:serine/threonine protein kinase